jgi:Arc/MetJ-type ribon-helix-helix transcriptional regulator
MSTISLRLPDSLHKQVRRLAEKGERLYQSIDNARFG